MSPKELLLQKLTRLKSIAIEFEASNPKISKDLSKAYNLLSDPSTNLDIVPREIVNEEVKFLSSVLIRTFGNNRKILLDSMIKDIKDEKNLIKKKLEKINTSSEENIISGLASLKLIRKIISGVTEELPFSGVSNDN